MNDSCKDSGYYMMVFTFYNFLLVSLLIIVRFGFSGNSRPIIRVLAPFGERFIILVHYSIDACLLFTHRNAARCR
jgi:hypothetical protein